MGGWRRPKDPREKSVTGVIGTLSSGFVQAWLAVGSTTPLTGKEQEMIEKI